MATISLRECITIRTNMKQIATNINTVKEERETLIGNCTESIILLHQWSQEIPYIKTLKTAILNNEVNLPLPQAQDQDPIPESAQDSVLDFLQVTARLRQTKKQLLELEDKNTQLAHNLEEETRRFIELGVWFDVELRSIDEYKFAHKKLPHYVEFSMAENINQCDEEAILSLAQCHGRIVN